MYNTVGSDTTIVSSPLSSLGYQAKRASILKRSPKISGGDGGELNSPDSHQLLVRLLDQLDWIG